MSNSLKIAYPLPWFSIQDHIIRLKADGLTILETTQASEFLGHVGYYAVSGYCLAFQDATKRFTSTVTFDQIQSAYRFDVQLRDLLNEALEWIEIDLCATVSNYFGKQYGPFGHTEAGSFHQQFSYTTSHSSWLTKLHEEAKRSQEPFVNHFNQTYIEYPDLPIWVAVEIMSFGSLSHMISAMKKHDRRQVANDYGVSPGGLAKAVHHFTYIRNLCAHHSRLWGKVWKIMPELPNDTEWSGQNTVSNRRLFSTFLLIRHMLKRRPSINGESNEWRKRVTSLLQVLPEVPDPHGLLGLPINWTQHPVWQ